MQMAGQLVLGAGLGWGGGGAVSSGESSGPNSVQGGCQHGLST